MLRNVNIMKKYQIYSNFALIGNRPDRRGKEYENCVIDKFPIFHGKFDQNGV